MASKHEIEIVIFPTGEVNVHVKGAKGKQCMKYLELLSTLGQVKNQKTTSEFYEPGPVVNITDLNKTRHF